ncbi:LOB domain-containing protein 30-like [Silene latifolia]|uniref:LOB domain-containing protein 30-like n=1 Tax=Silene latifolia TaxID=37657 RepID=UPI003D777491
MSCANPSSSCGGGGSGSGGGGGGGGGPCGACKFLRRKCVNGCIFAPYFDSEQGAAHFAAVHKVFGASNVSKLLLHIPTHKRLDAVVTICYEAQARLRDPVYGCVAHIFALQQQVVNLQTELSYLQAHLATLEVPTPPPLPPQPMMMPPQLSISDLPSATTVPATYDLSSLFDPMVQPSWFMQQQQEHQRGPIDLRQFGSTLDGGPIHGSSSSGRGDLHGIGHMHDPSPSSSMSK